MENIYHSKNNYLLENFSSKSKFDKTIMGEFLHSEMIIRFDAELVRNPNLSFNDFLMHQYKPSLNKENLENYLKKYIHLVSDTEINRFKYFCEEKSLYTKQQREGYAKKTIEYLEENANKIEQNNTYTREVKRLLYEQIKIIKIKLKKYLANPYPDLRKKLEFNWNKNDIQALFFLFKENKILNNTTSADIGNIIDTSFKYLNSSGEYEDIINSRKHLNDYQNDEKGLKKSIERLREILQNPDFYNI